MVEVRYSECPLRESSLYIRIMEEISVENIVYLYVTVYAKRYGMGHKKVPSMRLFKKRILTVPRKRNVRKTTRCDERACNGKLNGACNGKLNGACYG